LKSLSLRERRRPRGSIGCHAARRVDAADEEPRIPAGDSNERRENEFPERVCEGALAHTLLDTTEAAYNRTDLFDRRRELIDAWTRHATGKPADAA
jgi:hypothetical protein